MSTATHASRVARGLRLLHVYLPEETMRRLDAICEDSGYSRPDQVAGMIDAEYAEWQAVRADR